MTTSHNPTDPLTQEELDKIEANNQLIKIFGAFIQDIESKNPNADIPAQLLYSAFTLGALSVHNAHANAAANISRDLHEVRGVMTTYIHHARTEGSTDETN